MFIQRFKVLLSLSLVLLLALNIAYAAPNKNKVDRASANTGDQEERALKAANVIRQLVNTPESNIPPELLDHAKAIAVIPNLVKAALGVGGAHGKGLVARRTTSGWGTPAFIDLSGGSFGFQIGVSAVDLVLIFTKEDGLKGLLEDKVELGGEAGVAAGPIGRAAEAGTNLTFDSPIYSYSRSKGLFAGIALKGSVMTVDDSANHKVYGNNISGKDILLRGTASPTPVVEPFLQALNKYEPATKIAKKSGHHEAAAENTSTPTRKMSMPNDNVKKAQEKLRDKGYDPGPADGVLGPQTKSALRKYQESENLPVTGRLDAETAAKLDVEPQSVSRK
jgi:lipid-binding SYLF domain-containing protein